MARVLCTIDHTRHAGRGRQRGDRALSATRGPARPRRRRRALRGRALPRLRRACTPLRARAGQPCPRASRAARAAGLSPTIALRTGEPRAEALSAARVLGAGELVFAEPRPLLRRGSDVVVVSVAGAAANDRERLAA